MKSRIFTTVMLLATAAAAQNVPQKLSYAGRLTKLNGTPETGAPSFTFKVFDSASGGTEKFSETKTILLGGDGSYSTTLDFSTASADLFDGSGPRYLEVQVNGNALLPRSEISSVPYAYTARNVKGGTVDATAVKVNGVDLVSNGKLSSSFGYSAGSGITINASNAISMSNCVTDGQVLVWNNSSSSWSCGTATGPKGDKGDKGDTGLKGDKGDTGNTGSPGINGVSVAVATVSSGDATCPNGGVRVIAPDGGISSVCNGANGSSSSGGRNLIRWNFDLAQWSYTPSSNIAITQNSIPPTDVMEANNAFDFETNVLSTGIIATWGSDFIPVNPNKSYEGRVYAKTASGTYTGLFFMGFVAYDRNKNQLDGNQSANGPIVNAKKCSSFIADAVPAAGLSASYKLFAGRVTGEGTGLAQFPVGTRFIKPCIGTNLGVGTIGVTRIGSLEIFEVDTSAGFTSVQSFVTPTGVNAVDLVLPSYVQRVWLRAWGGGGGGGAASGTACNTSATAASGGGGGYAEGFVSVASGTTLKIIVGAGGAAGSVSVINAYSGGAGGASYVYTSASPAELVRANGGGGGTCGGYGCTICASSVPAGAGGTAPTGQVRVSGTSGTPGSYGSCTSQVGGSAGLGGTYGLGGIGPCDPNVAPAPGVAGNAGAVWVYY